jgi:8-oxo-dGTP pyrophosphatase MutT (NUDIX family)
VLAAVIRRQDRYLVCRRPAHKRHGGLWEFPGGKLEPGETLLEAARRELREELGAEVSDLPLVAAVGAHLPPHCGVRRDSPRAGSLVAVLRVLPAYPHRLVSSSIGGS